MPGLSEHGQGRRDDHRAQLPDHGLRGEHAPHNAIDDPGEAAGFRDRCSPLMAALLDELARTPGDPRPLPAIEDALGWPRRRIASVLGGVSHPRHRELGGRRPYRFFAPADAASGRWELWADATQAAGIRAPPGGLPPPRSPG